MPRLALLTLFGLATIASGLLRYLPREGGEKGLWFGLICGTLALLGALVLARGNTRLGLGLAYTAIAFVVGWYTFELFFRGKALAEAETRHIAVLLVGLWTATRLWAGRGASHRREQAA